MAAANSSLFGKLIGSVAVAVMLVLGLIFSVALLAVVLVIGLGAFGYFWWKTRALRKSVDAHVPGAGTDGQTFEGVAVVVEDWQAGQPQVLPADLANKEREETPPPAA